MPTRAQTIVPFVRENEEEERQTSPMGEIFLWPMPMPVYKALSDAASRRGLTLAMFLANAIDRALEE